MSARWWIRENVGLVDDDGHPAIGWRSLRPTEAAGLTAWIELPTTRWGRAHRELAARANFEHLERVFPFVQRVWAVEEGWRSLIVPEVELWRLEGVIDQLERGESVSTAAEAALMRRLLRHRVETVECYELVASMPDRVMAAGATEASHAIAGRMGDEAVVRAYLTLAADCTPLPVVDALGASFPAHEVVVARLVEAVSKRPELVMSDIPLAGAPSWQVYERWLVG